MANRLHLHKNRCEAGAISVWLLFPLRDSCRGRSVVGDGLLEGHVSDSLNAQNWSVSHLSPRRNWRMQMAPSLQKNGLHKIQDCCLDAENKEEPSTTMDELRMTARIADYIQTAIISKNST